MAMRTNRIAARTRHLRIVTQSATRRRIVRGLIALGSE